MLKYVHVWRDMWPLLPNLCFMPGILVFYALKLHVSAMNRKISHIPAIPHDHQQCLLNFMVITLIFILDYKVQFMV